MCAFGYWGAGEVGGVAAGLLFSLKPFFPPFVAGTRIIPIIIFTYIDIFMSRGTFLDPR